MNNQAPRRRRRSVLTTGTDAACHRHDRSCASGRCHGVRTGPRWTL
jgi:hypothetical protein